MNPLRRAGLLWVWMVVGASTAAYAQNITTRVSVSTGGGQADGHSTQPTVSPDGRYVAFRSLASNLVAADTNGQQDVFIHDRHTGSTERVSVGPGNVQSNGTLTETPAMSADGRFVAFATNASNFDAGDTNDSIDVYVRDRQTSTTVRASITIDGQPNTSSTSGVAMTADGRYVLFSSGAPNLVADDTNNTRDIFLRDLQTGTTTRVNVGTAGAPAQGGPSSLGTISADGRVVAFHSFATNLVPDDLNGADDVFVRDLEGATTTRVSSGSWQVPTSGPSLSSDGRFVTFFSQPAQPGGGMSLYVRDRLSGTVSLLTQVGVGGQISGNGRYVCFESRYLFTVPFVFFVHLELYDRQTRLMRVVSTASNDFDASNSRLNNECSIDADGSTVVFASGGSNLVADDTNGDTDVFARSMLGNTQPALTLDRTALTFGAVVNGGAFVTHTGDQTVRLTQTTIEKAAWTATSNQPWLQVTPASGPGSAALSIGVQPAAGLPASGTVTGQITVTLTGDGSQLPPIEVSLTLTPTPSIGPFGTVDTPTENRTGVTGAVPFTGWALDNVEVTRVSICRAAFGGERAPIDPNCGGTAEMFVGFAVFIDGARPDVAATFGLAPLATRAGWGTMVLTNTLPDHGNGTYHFTMRAQDREGNWFVLGTRTMTCANASATLPFGTLDTPAQGGLPVSGSSYVNFGWVLTPLPKTIPLDGLTIHVLVDGVDVGTADYNHARPDIQAAFPGLNNTNSAVGFRILDTTAMTNGLHTISWTVTDDAGATEGIGSRFFTVSNEVEAVTAAATTASSTVVDVDAARLDTTAVVGRRGWDLEAPYGSFGAGANGVTVIRSEEVNRVELQLGAGNYSGYLQTPAGFAPLPIGSRLDGTTNTFTWAPGVGFVGPYNFVFVRSVAGQPVSRRDVRIVLHPKARGSVGPQVVIDAPRAPTAMQQPFSIGGWAVDLGATEGTGVTTLHAWAFPTSGGAPIFLGATAYGGVRPDVAALHGDRFKASGFALIVQGLPAGDYDLALFAWSTETMGFVAPTFVRVRLNP
jgi:Tol biopolymer transport system component